MSAQTKTPAPKRGPVAFPDPRPGGPKPHPMPSPQKKK